MIENNLVKTDTNKELSLKDFLTNSVSLKDLLTGDLKHAPFIAGVVSTVLADPKLKECSKDSILKCCLKSAQLGLPIDASGFAYLVPRYNSKANKTDLTFQIGYLGYIALARKSPNVKTITSFAVFEGEYNDKKCFSENRATGKISYSPNYDLERTEKTLKIVVAVITYTNGGAEYEVMTKAEVDKVRKVNVKEGNFSPWTEWFIQMATKSVIKRLLKKCCFALVIQANELDEEYEEPQGSPPIKDIKDVFEDTSNEKTDDLQEAPKQEPLKNKEKDLLGSKYCETDDKTSEVKIK